MYIRLWLALTFLLAASAHGAPTPHSYKFTFSHFVGQNPSSLDPVPYEPVTGIVTMTFDESAFSSGIKAVDAISFSGSSSAIGASDVKFVYSGGFEHSILVGRKVSGPVSSFTPDEINNVYWGNDDFYMVFFTDPWRFNQGTFVYSKEGGDMPNAWIANGSGKAAIEIYTPPPPPPPSPVPEPEAYAMVLAGLALLGLVARRRRQKPG